MYQNIPFPGKFFWQKQEKDVWYSILCMPYQTSAISMITVAAAHFSMHPMPAHRRSAWAAVLGSITYHRKSSISFWIFSGQKEKSDHLSGSQS